MNIYTKKIRWKFLLLLIAIGIGVGSLYYTRVLVDKLAEEEKNKVEIWAQATAWISQNNMDDDEILDFLLQALDKREIMYYIFQAIDKDISSFDTYDSNNDSILLAKIENYRKMLLSSRSRRRIIENIREQRNIIGGFMLQIIQNNETIPVIVTNNLDSILFSRNLRKQEKLSNPEYAKRLINEIKEEGKVIEIIIPDGKQYLYYDNSLLLTKLIYFPYFQLGVILLFILVAYLAFSASRNAEQNQVWVGLSKETAHQLGTPTSSLMAWVEILKQKNNNDVDITELNKDVQRLKKITDRFSKIGSKPKLKGENVIYVLNNAVEYIKRRSSNKVQINIEASENEITIPLNIELFEWVIENLCKNAIDAMQGTGDINIKITDNTQVIYIDITDTGKGIPKSKFKTIFKPGYTTKERGWGLGLSLSERIIENYHDGKIFVHYSEVGSGTRFRIVLKKFF